MNRDRWPLFVIVLAFLAVAIGAFFWLVLFRIQPLRTVPEPTPTVVRVIADVTPTWAPTPAAVTASPRATGTSTLTQEPAVIDLRTSPTPTVTPMPPLVLFDDPTVTPTSTPMPVQKG